MSKVKIETLEINAEILHEGVVYRVAKILELDVKIVVKGTYDLYPVFLPFGTKVKPYKPEVKVLVSELSNGEKFKYKKAKYIVVSSDSQFVYTVKDNVFPTRYEESFYPATLVIPIREQPVFH